MSQPIIPLKTRFISPSELLIQFKPNLFAIPLGILALAVCWSKLAIFAHANYHYATILANSLKQIGLAGLVILLSLFLLKLLCFPRQVWQAYLHPGLGASFALIPVSCLLALSLLIAQFPDQRQLWHGITLFALAMQGLIAWRVVSLLSTGQLHSESVSPVLYLPIVPGGFMGAIVLDQLALPGFAMLLFGMGIGGWALLEIRILHRLFAGPLAADVRPSIGLEIAPAAVGTLAALHLWPQMSGEIIMIGVGVSSGPIFAILTRWRWWSELPFSLGFWSFSFPLAAVTTAIVEAVHRAAWPREVALFSCVLMSLIVLLLIAQTLRLALRHCFR